MPNTPEPLDTNALSNATEGHPAPAPSVDTVTSALNEKPAPTVAPRPHWITIVLGTLSPLMGVVALAISWRGYLIATDSFRISQQSSQTAEKSLKVGQRAYLFVRVSPAVLDAPSREDVDNEIELTRHGTLPFKICNLGNTPAYELEMTVKPWADAITRLPFTWMFYEVVVDGRTYQVSNQRVSFKLESQAPPKGDCVDEQLRVHVGIHASTLKQLRSVLKFFPRWSDEALINPFSGTLKYTDVFGDRYSLDWRWERLLRQGAPQFGPGSYGNAIPPR